MAWTKAQQMVIDTRNKNLLVSAAAGSGKTAVLVERIISMISEGENPLDIDHLLVVTFTNAAAAEMRGRIGRAIDEKLQKEPENLHLQKQVSLLQSAQITTIHSFCLNVIRNYFHRIDLDPSFKIAEEAEITLMKSDVLSELLERWYEEGREDFHAFVESYSYSKSDAPIEDLILQLYHFSMSDPWPKSWIAEKRRMFEVNSVKEMSETSWVKELLNYLGAVLGDLSQKNREALCLCSDADGPAAYTPALTSDFSLLELLKKADTYEQCVQSFSDISFDRLSGKKQEGVAEWKKDKVKALREEVKKGIKDITGQFFFQPPDEMLKDLQAVGKIMQVLFDLTLEFMDDFARKKEEKNLVDFNDLEHFALKILVSEQEDENGKIQVPTPAALELSEQFEEILIDEYQDSNMVQETILKSISREAAGRPNRFMVGDVKQSIYKFRLAMPEIFMEKYMTYSCEDITEGGQINLCQRIDLDKNFRSRNTVLDYVNKVFEQIMQKQVGGIVYDDAASLKYGELFEELLKAKTEDADHKTEGAGNKANLDIAKGITDTDKADNTINLNIPEGIINTDKAESKENLNMPECVTVTDKAENTLLPEEIEKRIPSEVELLLVTDEDIDPALKGNENPESKELQSDNFYLNEKTGEKSAGASLDEDPEEAQYTKKELEARVIARKIKELTDPDHGMLVFDRSTKTHRPAAYRDIVILLRSMANWSEVMVNTLMQEGIPAFADTGTGYFQTLEIMTILNMLRIIDNPRQDIPLTGVLYSPIVGMTSTQLALIRSNSRSGSMYSALAAYAEGGDSGELKGKVTDFMEKLTTFRSMVNHTPIHELIQTVLDQTGYYYYVSTMPGGDRRKANIDMLILRAVSFERGSYSGLFHFIRYIEKLHKYEVDFGEAAAVGEQDNTVRIMSIHKSKGLEFPIVFAAGMNKQFNTQDVRSNIVLHSELGVGPEYIDSNLRTKVPTLVKKVIQKKVQIETMGEELRVLYVALTRAKEKLILTGYLKTLDEIKEKKFSFFEIMSAKSYLDLVLPATVNRIGIKPVTVDNTLVYRKDHMSITVCFKKDLLRGEVTKQIFLHKEEQDLLSINPDNVYDQELRDKMKDRFGFLYRYQKEAGLKVKMTVSELKKLGQLPEDEFSVSLYGNNKQEPSESWDLQAGTLPSSDTKQFQQSDEDAVIPDFISKKQQAVSGTDRGTLYHKVLELIDLTRIYSKDDLEAELNRLIQSQRLKESDIKLLKPDYINQFISSNIAKRMRQAEALHKLYREKQFVIGIKAAEVVPDVDSSELILIQGIIDVFFEEDGELVLLDYKSDLVTEAEQLVKRYKVQLQYYRKALEQILNKKVKETIIYSLPLGREIRIDL